jgi:molybdopterin/thiamine biosynthesis adenylyltransferase
MMKLLTEEERKLYDRQLRIQGWSQELLKNSTVMVAGVGALGCEIAKNLALCGIGKLILVDYDKVETSNLSRQLLFRSEDRGEFKVSIAKKHLHQSNRFIEIETYTSRIENVELSAFEDSGVLVSGLDGVIPRLELNAKAVMLDKPAIFGGFEEFDGWVQVVLPHSKFSCMRCSLEPTLDQTVINPCIIRGIPEIREHCAFKADIEFQSVNQRLPDLSNEDDLNWVFVAANRIAEKYGFGTLKKEFVKFLLDNKAATMIITPSIIGGIQANEVVKLLHLQKGRKIGAILDGASNLMTYNGKCNQFSFVSIYKRDNCENCSDEFKEKLGLKKAPILAVKASDTFEGLFSSLSEAGIELDPAKSLVMKGGRTLIWPRANKDAKVCELVGQHDFLLIRSKSRGSRAFDRRYIVRVELI